MKKHIFYTLGLALALTSAGAWAVDTQGTGNGAGAGTDLQNPAPVNPNPPAPPDQSAPNAAQPNPAPPDQAQPNPAPENPAQPNPDQTNPAPPNAAPVNPAPPDQTQPNPAPPSANPSNPPIEGQQAAAPAYSSPLQEFMSRNLDEVGALSQEINQFQAAKRPEAVMATYHMIREHRLLADAAANILARRGEATTPSFMIMPAANSPEEAIHQQLQMHQDMASNLQQMISNASSPDEKRLYQKALNGTNQHVAWLQSFDQNQNVQVGFFGPTTPLGDLSGTTTVASAAGYPQPVISRTAGFQQQLAGSGSAGYGRRTAMRRSYRHRRYRHGRYSRYSRYNHYNRTTSYR